MWKAFLGGGAQLNLSVESLQVPRGTAIKGRLVVIGGDIEQSIHNLVLTLIQIEERQQIVTTTDSSGNTQTSTQTQYVSHELTALSYGVVQVLPQKTEEFFFEIPIPREAYRNRKTMLMAQAVIAWAVDPKVSVDIEILADPELASFYSALNRLGFTYNPHNIRIGKILSHPMERCAFHAPPMLAQQFDGVITAFGVFPSPSGGSVLKGDLIINRAEQNFTDRLKALVGGDLVAIPLEIPSTILCHPETQEPTPEGAIPSISMALESAKIALPSEKDWLLRASSAPPEKHLLRPATYIPDHHPEELLRPSEPKDETLS
jgi:hypothetical protein